MFGQRARRSLFSSGKSPSKGSYKCQRCDKTFTQKGSLNRHSILHSGNFKWYCDICDKGYSQRGNYEQHIRAHKGQKFKCEYCGKAFSTEITQVSLVGTYGCLQLQLWKMWKRIQSETWLFKTPRYLQCVNSCNVFLNNFV